MGTVAVAVPVVLPAAATPCAAATWSHHVALVVEHADGASVRLCIGFDAPSITGAQILAAAHDGAGLEYATAEYGSLGDAVCQLDHEPASYPPSCWTTTSDYWAMFVSRGGSPWQVSDHGIDAESFADGDAEGFRFDSQSGAAAPPVSPAGTCTVATSAPAPASTTTAASAPAGASPATTSSSPATPTPAGTGASRSPSPTPGVAAVPQPPATNAVATTGLSPGILAGVAGGSALAAMLAIQVVLRRHRP